MFGVMNAFFLSWKMFEDVGCSVAPRTRGHERHAPRCVSGSWLVALGFRSSGFVEMLPSSCSKSQTSFKHDTGRQETPACGFLSPASSLTHFTTPRTTENTAITLKVIWCVYDVASVPASSACFIRLLGNFGDRCRLPSHKINGPIAFCRAPDQTTAPLYERYIGVKGW